MMRRVTALAVALAALASGCSPTVYERAVDVCLGNNVAANEHALQRDHYLPPSGHVRCKR